MGEIHAKLAAVSAAVGAVKKDGYNQNQRFNFRGVDHVVNAVSRHLAEHGVVVFPIGQSVEHVAGKTSTGKDTNIVYGTVTYRFACGPDDFIDATVFAEANDAADKGTAKMLSVALRIALLQTLMLPTDDDDPDSSYEAGGPVSAHAVALQRVVDAANKRWPGDEKVAGKNAQALLASKFGYSGRPSQVEDVRVLVGLAEAIEGGE